MRETLLAVAYEALGKHLRCHQRGYVLAQAASRLQIADDDLERQQQLLTAWSGLFRDGTLIPGHDLDIPSLPFFHLAVRA